MYLCRLPALYVITLVVSGVALIVNASVLTIRAPRRAVSSSAASQSWSEADPCPQH